MSKFKLSEFKLNRKKFVFIILIAFAVLGLVQLILTGINGVKAEGDAQAGIDFVSEENEKDVQSQIKAVKKVEDQRQAKLEAAEALEQAEEVVEKIHAGELSYKNVLNDLYIMGDSLMETITATDLLNTSHIIAQVSAGLPHLEANMDTMIAKAPPILLIHYGENVLSSSEAEKDAFIEQYKADITKIKEALPTTRIIISLIFPAKSTAESALAYIDTYNEALKQMCSDLGVEYLDSAETVNNNSGYYEPDGIHMTANFYSIWFDFIIKDKGIIG